MTLHYTDPERESDKWALPDVETFHIPTDYEPEPEQDEQYEPGFYYWFCFPGCMPDSDPMGPYDSEEAAIGAVREEHLG